MDAAEWGKSIYCNLHQLPSNFESAAWGQIDQLANLPPDADKGEIKKKLATIRTQWHIILIAWWTLTGAAVLGLLRIFVSAIFYTALDEQASRFLFFWDMLIIFLMLLGYGVFLVIVAARAWKWTEARGRPFPR